MRNPISRLLATTALSAPLALTPIAALSAEIGTVAAVNPSMAGTPPTAQRRTLTLGQKLIENERVETSADGSGQLLFLDQTTLTVAPQSELVLDKYVYDPDQQTGEIALTMTKGVLRFIGGRITKKREAIVRTPTATVGIRGGLALVIVDSDGQTRVCHLAGEYTEVESDQSGVVTLSRPNACAVVDGVSARFGGLIRDAELQEVYELLEGDGSGGTAQSTSAADVSQVASVNSDAKAGQENQPVSTSGESSPDDESARDENLPDQDEGERVVQVNVGPPPPSEGGGGEPIEVPVVNTLGGGAFQSVDLTNTLFDNVAFGSLIGEGDGESIRVPVPGTGDNPAGFDTDTVLTNLGNPTFSALERDGNTGLFSFGTGEGQSTLMGDINGVGFLDPNASFAYVEFENDGGEGGFAVFGIAAEFQRQFFESDGLFSVDEFGLFEDTQFDLDGNQIDPDVVNIVGQQIFPAFAPGTTYFASADVPADASVNTVEAFELQPNLLFDLEPPQATLFLIGNQGMARFGRDSVTLDEGTQIGGGKWLSGTLDIQTDAATGHQNSFFTVLADDVKSFGDSGPVLAATGVSTGYEIDTDGGGGLRQSTNIALSNLGTYEDADGATLFGRIEDGEGGADEGQYLVVSSLTRNGFIEGDSVPPGPVFDPGTTVELIQSEGDPSIGAGDSFDRIEDDVDATINFLAINDDLAERVTNPLPLAGNRTETGYDAPLNQFNRGFATGFARCETGACGRFGTGLYALETNQRDSFLIQFDTTEVVFGSDGSTSIETAPDNELVFQFEVTSTEAGPIAGTDTGEGTVAIFQFSGTADTSAYIDDNRFGGTVVNGTGGADIALASAGLVGDGGIFPSGVDTTPEFVRWGWWSAALDQPLETGVTRTDIVHLGNFVTGVRPDEFADSIPIGFTATYDGFAVGQHANLFTGETRIVGGSFGLTYDFGGRNGDAGQATLNIPDAGLIDVSIPVVGAANGLTFAGSFDDDSTVTTTQVSGGFFSDGVGEAFGSGVAGVGGEFRADALEFGTQTIGIFGADRTSLESTVIKDITDGSLVIDTGIGTGPGGNITNGSVNLPPGG